MTQYSFLDSYIGIPYDHYGDGYEATNCYSLIRRIFKEQRGIDLPDWALDDTDIKTVIRSLQRHIREEIKNRVAMPVLNGDRRDWDIVTVERNSGPHHIGIYIANGILHADRGYGSRWEPLYQFEYAYSGSKFRWWRWPCV